MLTASPSLSSAPSSAICNGTLIRPYVRAGTTFFDDPDFALKRASRERRGRGVLPHCHQTDDQVADVCAGIDLIGPAGAELRLFYDGRFGDLKSRSNREASRQAGRC